MNRDILLRHLAEERRCMARAKKRITTQRRVIAELEHAGQDSSWAHRVLEILEDTHALHQENRRLMIGKL